MIPHVFLLPVTLPGPLPSSTIKQGWVAFMIDSPDTWLELDGIKIGELKELGMAKVLAAGSEKEHVLREAHERAALLEPTS